MHELVKNAYGLRSIYIYQVEISLKAMNRRLGRYVKDSFTSHMSQVLKKQSNNENQNGTTYVPCVMPSLFEIQG